MSAIESDLTRRSALQRLISRWRNGLLVQEALDRLARVGCVVRPYYVTTEGRESPSVGPLPAGFSTRELRADDAADLVRITVRALPQATVLKLLQEHRGFGLFLDGSLVGYTWVQTGRVPVPGSGAALFALASHEAYLFDMYVKPQCRGARLAPALRACVLAQLAHEGRRSCYSITLRFNRASRRFKQRLGVHEAELRVYFHLRLGRLPGVDVRIWQRGMPLPAPFWLRIPARHA